MTVLIALFRGVNVGGHGKLPMQALRSIAEAHGAKDVSTYIQSGNLVCRSPSTGTASLQKKLGAAIEGEYGFKPEILIIDRAALDIVLQNNPFAARGRDPSKLHVVFLKSKANKNALKDVENALSNSERIKAVGATIYFDAPDGVGRSKAAEKLARGFPDGTMRNWRTCLKLEEMAAALT